jgi:hypothetical protein
MVKENSFLISGPSGRRSFHLNVDTNWATIYSSTAKIKAETLIPLIVDKTRFIPVFDKTM